MIKNMRILICLVMAGLFLQACPPMEPQDETGSTPYINNQVVAGTPDNIVNGDFTNFIEGYFPDGWGKFGNYWIPQYLPVYNSRLGVINLSADFPPSGGMGISQQYLNPITLGTNPNVIIEFKIDSSTLNGDGVSGLEAPVIFSLVFTNMSGSSLTFKRMYNITDDGDSASNPEFQSVSADVWTTVTNVATNQGYRLFSVSVYSLGWDRNSYVSHISFQ